MHASHKADDTQNRIFCISCALVGYGQTHIRIGRRLRLPSGKRLAEH
jgi:hypothetical protein